jgi:asparagine synthase (glutamine-hydrolysing)
MCGIAGIISTDGKPVDPAELARARQAISHRGPDGAHDWISADASCGFAHARLAILDTGERADQPMSTTDGHLTIVYNGEIFNFLEVRQELVAKGIAFHTESDTEVLLQAYVAWGEAMLPRLNGMWAFAIRDNRSGTVFFARDRFGIKPFLYTENAGRFAFASEMRGLLALDFVPRDLDTAVTERLLFDPFGVEGSSYTIHQAIRRLPGGHCAVLRDGRFTTRRWWVTADHLGEPPKTLGAAAEQFRDLFFESTKLRMRSDVRIGTCLSGGFDSPAVASAMARIADDGAASHEREADDWRHAFIAGMSGLDQDETARALIAAEYAGVTPHVLDLAGDDPLALVDAVLEAQDEIYISLIAAPWRIYQAVRAAGVRVTLDGHGADEMIGGYRQQGASLKFMLRNLVGDQAGRTGVATAIGDTLKRLDLKRTGCDFLRRGGLTSPERLPIAAYDDRLPDYYDRFDSRLYAMFHATVLPTILRNFDRISMSHGIEVRMPFMDWRLVTFAMSLPGTMKSADGYTKLVAREAMTGFMPEAIRSNRTKLGFNSQMPEWLNGPLGTWALRQLATPHGAFDAIVDRAALATRVEGLNRSLGWTWENSGRLWPYINLKWYCDRRC